MHERLNTPVQKTSYFTWRPAKGEGPFELESGKTLPEFTLGYQTYGELSPKKDNAILLCHALSGDSHVAGVHEDDGRIGWWDDMVGPGKPFDTDRYFIICSNVLGGCQGSSGPASLHPEDGKPYALRFPMVTITDMVRAQRHMLAHLGVDCLLSVSGGSMGGMQALKWSRLYPDMVKSAIPIATAARHTAQSIAWNDIGRRAIMGDPNWAEGNYYGEGVPKPIAGLGVARMVGHVTYLSEHSMEEKFGRRWQEGEGPGYGFGFEYAVESYLAYQAEKFNARFDANSYLYITRALDYFDFARIDRDDVDAFSKTEAEFLFISYTSDWLYPPVQNRALYEAALKAGCQAEYLEVDTTKGHDGFLIEAEHKAEVVTAFLQRISAA